MSCHEISLQVELSFADYHGVSQELDSASSPVHQELELPSSWGMLPSCQGVFAEPFSPIGAQHCVGRSCHRVLHAQQRLREYCCCSHADLHDPKQLPDLGESSPRAKDPGHDVMSRACIMNQCQCWGTHGAYRPTRKNSVHLLAAGDHTWLSLSRDDRHHNLVHCHSGQGCSKVWSDGFQLFPSRSPLQGKKHVLQAARKADLLQQALMAPEHRLHDRIAEALF